MAALSEVRDSLGGVPRPPHACLQGERATLLKELQIMKDEGEMSIRALKEMEAVRSIVGLQKAQRRIQAEVDFLASVRPSMLSDSPRCP